MRRIVLLRLVGVWVMTLALLTACAPQAATSAPPPAPYFNATDVSMDSPSDGWAVGNWITPHDTLPGYGPAMSIEYASITPAMAHLQGGQWRLAPESVTGHLGYSQILDLVRMLSPTDGWATGQGIFYHYDGVRWNLAFASDSTTRIADMQMLSPAFGWAVGPDGILQYTHGAWHDVTASLPPRTADWAGWTYPGLHSVAVVSTADAWAMGDGGVIWHYDGAHWRIVASPYFPNRFYTSEAVDGIAVSDDVLTNFAQQGHNTEAILAAQMLSPTQGWSVGGATLTRDPTSWGPGVIEQYRAGAWQVAHIVTKQFKGSLGSVPVFYSLAMTSAEDGWIGGAWVHPAPRSTTGDMPPPPGPPVYATLLLRYQAGQWTFVSTPTEVGAIRKVVMVSPDEGWAAADGGLLHYSGGQWRLAPVLSAAPA